MIVADVRKVVNKNNRRHKNNRGQTTFSSGSGKPKVLQIHEVSTLLEKGTWAALSKEGLLTGLIMSAPHHPFEDPEANSYSIPSSLSDLHREFP